MSYMRSGKEMRWFEGKTTEYVYGTWHNESKKKYIWGGKEALKEKPEQWIELVGRMIYRETEDPDFADALVRKLAKTYRVEKKLRKEFLHPLGRTRKEHDPYRYYEDK